MPSIALFIKQLLSEDKYSSDFNDRINERIKELNAAQLQGIYNHLIATAKQAKSQTWAAANYDLISKIEGVLKERVEEAVKVEKILEEDRLKKAQKKRRVKEAKAEQVRVMRMITETARRSAEDEVRAEEQKRAAEAKLEVMAKVFEGEEKRNDMLKKVAVFFVVAVVVVSVASPSLLILLPCLGFVLLVTAILCYRAYQLTVVAPVEVDEEAIEMEIERRGDLLKKKAITALQEKERKFQEQVARDERERKMRKAQKKAQAQFEADLMAKRRKQQLTMANEVMSRQNSASVSMLNLSGRTTPLEDRSEASSYREVSTDYGSNPPSYPTTARSVADRRPSLLPTIRDSDSDHEEQDDDDGREDIDSEIGRLESRASSWRHSQPRSSASGARRYESDQEDANSDGDGVEEVQLFGEAVVVQAESLYEDFERAMMAHAQATAGESSDDQASASELEHIPEADEGDEVVDLEAPPHFAPSRPLTSTMRPPSRPVSHTLGHASRPSSRTAVPSSSSALTRNAPGSAQRLRSALSKGSSGISREVSFKSYDSDADERANDSRGGKRQFSASSYGSTHSTPRVAKSVSFRHVVEDGPPTQREQPTEATTVGDTNGATKDSDNDYGGGRRSASHKSSSEDPSVRAEPKTSSKLERQEGPDIEMGVMNIEDG